MNWINNLFYMGLFTALTGSIAFAVYAVVAGVLDGLKKYRYIYGLLLVVLPFWLFPGIGIVLTDRELSGYLGPVLNMFITIPVNFVMNKFWAYRQKE